MRGVVCVLLVAVAVGVGACPTGAQEKPELTWYGFVKLDAAWDEGLVDAGNFARWVVSPEAFEEHGHFNMTARQTRLGVTMRSQVASAKLAGRWEADFYGGGAENKNWLQVRHAYVEIAWPAGWSILAGQASDVISPLAPGTLNYTVQWWAGNIGYRRPQLRLTRRFDLGEGRTLRFEAAATRTIGDDFTEAEPGDAGSDSGVPTFQGLAGLDSGPLTLGLFVHRGDENLHGSLGGSDVTLATSGWGGYLNAKSGRLSVAAEAWAGSNVDDYLGGIGQGVRIVQSAASSVDAAGGWAELTVRGSNGVRFALGASMDDVDRDDLGQRARDKNQVLWGTLVRDFGGGLSAGVELSRWETTWVGLETGRSLRLQGSVIYTF